MFSGSQQNAYRRAGTGLVQQRAAVDGAGVWWGSQGLQPSRYGSFVTSAAWASSGVAYGASVQPRDLAGNRIAEVYGHRGDQGEKVGMQYAVEVSRRNSAVALGSAEGSRAARVRGVSKQDLQWMLVQWQHDQHARRKIVEQGGHAWVSWQQEMEARENVPRTKRGLPVPAQKWGVPAPDRTVN